MIEQTVRYGFETRVHGDYAAVLERVRDALAAEGFGVLTEIDVGATLKKKLGVDFRRYTILGACNPPLAHRALMEELEIGLLLPCNVVVYDAGEGEAVVAAMDPVEALSVAGSGALAPIAAEVKARMVRVLESVSSGGGA